MNCRNFDAILLELVREGEESAGLALEQGRAHAAGCARCAALLSQQRRLSAALKALATCADENPSPQRIEAALRAEFRRHHARSLSPGVPRRAGAIIQSTFRILGNRWALAVSAVLIAVTGVVVTGRFLKKQRVTPLIQTQQQPAVQPSAPRRPVVATAHSQPFSAHPAALGAARQRGSSPRAMGRSRPSPARAQDFSHERAANFYPLPYGSGLGLDEGWQMVRVNMPVSALISLGIPVTNGGLSDHYVQADVVLGGDGMARAIRFVE